jgi:hypothetical protein
MPFSRQPNDKKNPNSEKEDYINISYNYPLANKKIKGKNF